MALFKQPDNIVKRIQIANPDLNPYNGPISTKKDAVDPLRDIPVVFGPNFLTPILVHKQFANFFTGWFEDLQLDTPEFRYYALSAGKTLNWIYSGNQQSYIDQIFIDGKFAGVRTCVIDDTTYLATSFPNEYWGYGRGLSRPTYIAAATNNSEGFGNRGGLMPGYNLYVTFLKAGDDFTQTAFYTRFGPKGKQPNNLFIPKNKDYDMLIMLLRYDNRVFKSADPLIQCSYFRRPIVKNLSGNFVSAEPTRGNCLLELLTNDAWGINLPDNKIQRSDFFNVGENISAQFDIVKTPISEMVSIIDNESVSNRVTEIGGLIRYASLNNTGLAITDDNIIGNIEIEYPDARLSPTQIIGTYNSYLYGSTDIIIGDDPTKVEKLNIRTAGTLEEAATILENIFRKLQNTITIKFKGDRTLQQISIYDRLTLSTTVFSATITIVEIKMQDDYTFDIIAEADTNDAVPEARLGSARPLIQIDDNTFFKPDVNEPPVVEPDQQEPIIILPPQPVPPPDEIAPPPPTQLTIAGLEHPYNLVTQSYNTDWYVGSTLDGTTIDSTYDVNGVRTRLLNDYSGGSGGAFYEMDFSLIFRPLNAPLPTVIYAVGDVHEGSAEYANNLVGTTNWSRLTRFQFPGFFNDRPSLWRTYNIVNPSWREGSTDWTALSFSQQVYGGNLDPIYKRTTDLPNYVYQVGNVDNVVRRFRTFHTIEENFSNIARPVSSSNFRYSSRGMRRTFGPGQQAYRIHFAAGYGTDARSITRVNYIGSTSFWGDGRGLLSPDRAQAIQDMSKNTLPFVLSTWISRYPAYVAPPARNIS